LTKLGYMPSMVENGLLEKVEPEKAAREGYLVL
jgi:hypothetical protein